MAEAEAEPSEMVQRTARALYDHDWRGSTDANREAVWLMHHEDYLRKAQALADAGLLCEEPPETAADWYRRPGDSPRCVAHDLYECEEC
jgi:hypothetical protein